MATIAKRRHLERHGEHDLAALIGLYEANYTRLTQLVPELDQLDGTVVGAARQAGCPIAFR